MAASPSSRLLRSEADFREAIAQAPDQASRDLLTRHLDTLRAQLKLRAALAQPGAPDPFAGIRQANYSFDEAM